MKLTIHTMPAVEFVAPDLVGHGAIRRGSGGESPTVTVTLDNSRGQLTSRVQEPPLRRGATLSDDAGATVFAGVVQSVTLANGAVSVVLES